MRGLFRISDEVDRIRPHQPSGTTRFVQFRDFPPLSVGDQFGFRLEDDSIECNGLIVHARSFRGIDAEGVEVWDIHCHTYTMRAGVSCIPDVVWEKIKRKRKYDTALPLKLPS